MFCLKCKDNYLFTQKNKQKNRASIAESNHIQTISNNDDEDSDDEDEEYDNDLRKYNKDIEKSLNFSAKPAGDYQNKFCDDSSMENKYKYADIVENESDKPINQIMRERFVGLSPEPYTYQRNEILIEDDMIKTLITKDIVPKLSFQNTPLFRHYNTINGIKSMVKYLTNNCHQQIVNLLTFSFHILQDCLQLFCYIYQNGKIYGSRIFTKDLFETIPTFYKLSTIDDEDKEEVLENMKIRNSLQFDDDKMYKEYYKVLYSRKASKNNQVPEELGNQLTKFVQVWNQDHNFKNPLDVHELMELFASNKIDHKWLKNDCNQREFFTILMKDEYDISLISALWNHLKQIEYKTEKQQNVNSLQQRHTIAQQQRQINELIALVRMQQQKIYAQSQQIHQLKSNNHPSNINDCRSLTSSSSGRSMLQAMANCNPYGPPSMQNDYDNCSTMSQETNVVNNQIDQPNTHKRKSKVNLPLSPRNIEINRSFISWDSRCDGCRMSDQSSDEDHAEIKCAENDDNMLHDNNDELGENIYVKDDDHTHDVKQTMQQEMKDDNIKKYESEQYDLPEINPDDDKETVPSSSSPAPSSPAPTSPAPTSPWQIYSNYGKNDTIFSDRGSRYCMDVTRVAIHLMNNGQLCQDNQWQEYMNTHRELINGMIEGWIFQQLNNLSKHLNHKN